MRNSRGEEPVNAFITSPTLDDPPFSTPPSVSSEFEDRDIFDPMPPQVENRIEPSPDLSPSPFPSIEPGVSAILNEEPSGDVAPPSPLAQALQTAPTTEIAVESGDSSTPPSPGQVNIPVNPPPNVVDSTGTLPPVPEITFVVDEPSASSPSPSSTTDIPTETPLEPISGENVPVLSPSATGPLEQPQNGAGSNGQQPETTFILPSPEGPSASPVISMESIPTDTDSEKIPSASYYPSVEPSVSPSMVPVTGNGPAQTNEVVLAVTPPVSTPEASVTLALPVPKSPSPLPSASAAAEEETVDLESPSPLPSVSATAEEDTVNLESPSPLPSASATAEEETVNLESPSPLPSATSTVAATPDSNDEAKVVPTPPEGISFECIYFGSGSVPDFTSADQSLFSGDVSQFSVPATLFPSLAPQYLSHTYGTSWSYKVPAEIGETYNFVLAFAEVYDQACAAGTGFRKFTVSLEGKTLDVDIIELVGCGVPLKAQITGVVAKSEFLSVAFVGVEQNAMLNTLCYQKITEESQVSLPSPSPSSEPSPVIVPVPISPITPTPSPTPSPSLVVVSGITEDDGGEATGVQEKKTCYKFGSDPVEGFLNIPLPPPASGVKFYTSNGAIIEGTDSDSAYASHIFGEDFTVFVTTGNAIVTAVELGFAEIFDVICEDNGRIFNIQQGSFSKNVDVFQEVGCNTALTVRIDDVFVSADGTIDIYFSKLKNNAMVSVVCVIEDESGSFALGRSPDGDSGVENSLPVQAIGVVPGKPARTPTPSESVDPSQTPLQSPSPSLYPKENGVIIVDDNGTAEPSMVPVLVEDDPSFEENGENGASDESDLKPIPTAILHPSNLTSETVGTEQSVPPSESSEEIHPAWSNEPIVIPIPQETDATGANAVSADGQGEISEDGSTPSITLNESIDPTTTPVVLLSTDPPPVQSSEEVQDLGPEDDISTQENDLLGPGKQDIEEPPVITLNPTATPPPLATGFPVVTDGGLFTPSPFPLAATPAPSPSGETGVTVGVTDTPPSPSASASNIPLGPEFPIFPPVESPIILPSESSIPTPSESPSPMPSTSPAPSVIASPSPSDEIVDGSAELPPIGVEGPTAVPSPSQVSSENGVSEVIVIDESEDDFEEDAMITESPLPPSTPEVIAIVPDDTSDAIGVPEGAEVDEGGSITGNNEQGPTIIAGPFMESIRTAPEGKGFTIGMGILGSLLVLMLLVCLFFAIFRAGGGAYSYSSQYSAQKPDYDPSQGGYTDDLGLGPGRAEDPSFYGAGAATGYSGEDGGTFESRPQNQESFMYEGAEDGLGGTIASGAEAPIDGSAYAAPDTFPEYSSVNMQQETEAAINRGSNEQDFVTINDTIANPMERSSAMNPGDNTFADDGGVTISAAQPTFRASHSFNAYHSIARPIAHESESSGKQERTMESFRQVQQPWMTGGAENEEDEEDEEYDVADDNEDLSVSSAPSAAPSPYEQNVNVGDAEKEKGNVFYNSDNAARPRSRHRYLSMNRKQSKNSYRVDTELCVNDCLTDTGFDTYAPTEHIQREEDEDKFPQSNKNSEGVSNDGPWPSWWKGSKSGVVAEGTYLGGTMDEADYDSQSGYSKENDEDASYAEKRAIFEAGLGESEAPSTQTSGQTRAAPLGPSARANMAVENSSGFASDNGWLRMSRATNESQENEENDESVDYDNLRNRRQPYVKSVADRLSVGQKSFSTSITRDSAAYLTRTDHAREQMDIRKAGMHVPQIDRTSSSWITNGRVEV